VGHPTAGEVLQARLTEQVALLHRRDEEVREGADDAVHQLRVTCRRLRGALGTFRPVVEREVTDPFRDELRWLARTLGGARDAEVARERLESLLDGLPRISVVGPVRHRIRRTYEERQRTADEHAARVLGGARYRRLLARADAVAADPPFSDLAGEPADDVLVKRTHRDRKRFEARVALVADAQPRDVDAAWHHARKAAKRLRYAAETLEPGWGEPAAELLDRAKAVTKLLGERQDTVVLRTDLRRLARVAHVAGESTFTYGALHEAERATAARVDEEFDDAWRRLEGFKLR
jgi:CHAD domain-containing protein